MARKAKQAPVTTPRRIPAEVEVRPSREERRAERQLRERFASRQGWSGRFSGRAPVEDAGTVYTGPSTQAGGIFPWLLGSGLPRGVCRSVGTY
ncbi:hypothetical protein [Streptomyces sp. VB1]|uniref:hypothetical protein n=1 Tax=Streptomyces sp. VB1 TaxID=2986803 RepID=UPI0022419D18|nr:hypothetical protein [Streptomyces sp. VB1]UZI33940.1 hypothetical protein OH133_38710 [Streptomyces sp. VB1]